MKFGGTSVGSAERMRIAAGIAAEPRPRRSVAIVVSAMSKITDLLLDTLRRAEGGDQPGLQATIAKLRERHLATCRELLPPERQQAAADGIAHLIAEFERIAGGMLMLNEMPPRSVDEAVAIGERLSALLPPETQNAQATPAEAINAAEIVVTDAVFGNASPLMEPTRAKARARLLPLLEHGVLPVVTGFNGATADGRPTTLGRGGSDFSASILAAALDASELWIWTDVGGTMGSDPRLVPDAEVLQRRHGRWAPDHAGTRRLGLLGLHSGGRAGCFRAVDLDRRGRHHGLRSAAGARRRSASTAPRPMGARPRWDAAARTSRPPFWRPRWMLPSCGSGPTWAAPWAPIRGWCPTPKCFNGATADGRPTTLGRGGSDFSASILAAALDASELWIWTDVD